MLVVVVAVAVAVVIRSLWSYSTNTFGVMVYRCSVTRSSSRSVLVCQSSSSNTAFVVVVIHRRRHNHSLSSSVGWESEQNSSFRNYWLLYWFLFVGSTQQRNSSFVSHTHHSVFSISVNTWLSDSPFCYPFTCATFRGGCVCSNTRRLSCGIVDFVWKSVRKGR